MLLNQNTNNNYTARQLKLPLEIEKLIDISDPVYTFCEVMNHGFCSLREIEKLCRTDIRYMYLLDEMKAPSFATFGNFIRNELTDTIEQIFADGNKRIAATMFLYFPGICSVRPSIFQFSFVAPILLQRRQLPSQLPPKSNTFSYNFLYCFKMYLCNPFFSVVAHHKTAILFI